MFRGLRDLCSCHKSREKDADDDDLPYSPTKKSTVFFGSRKNTVTDKTLTSTPNQLINVRKLSENELIDNMDVRNNNNKYTASANDASLGSHLNDLPNSPIEKDSTTCINLDSNDDLNRLSMASHSFGGHLNDADQQTPSLRNANSRPPDQRTDLSELTDHLSSLWSKPIHEQSNDSNAPNTDPPSRLSMNSSTHNLSPNHAAGLSADQHASAARSENNLSSLESANGDKFTKPNGRSPLIDSIDNIVTVSSSTNHLDKYAQFPSNGGHLTDLEMNNLLNRLGGNLKGEQNRPDRNTTSKHAMSNAKRTRSNREGKELSDRNTNAIQNVINLPADTATLQRVSSDDKISLDNASIESMVVDRHSNELVRKSDHPHLSTNAIKHPNSIIFQETLKLTLKRDKNEKKSLNEFSMENLPKHMFENSSLMKEYFYDVPVIRTSSRFIAEDLATYRMQSDPRGYCLIINNATTTKDCLRLKNGFVREQNYLKDLFTKLGFIVETHSNLMAKDILKRMVKVKDNKISEKHDAFVFIFLGHGNQNYVIGEDLFKLNFELVIGHLNNYHCGKLMNKPKIFIVHTCNSNCQKFLEPIPPSNIPREMQALKKLDQFKIIPTWTDTVIIYSTFLNSDIYYSSFVKEFGRLLCSSAFEKSLHDILLEVGFRFLFVLDDFRTHQWVIFITDEWDDE